MKKSMCLWIVTVSMVILTACGLDKDHVESATQDGQEAQREELGVESMPSGADKSAPNAALSEQVYEAEIMRYSELSGEFSLRKDVEVTRTDHAAYYFETSIGMAERNACIAATDRALSCIDAVLPEIEIVVLSPESYDGILVSGNRLYMPVESWDSVDYIAKVLLAGYGEWSNYGMAYGYADYLCRKAGMEGAESGADDGRIVSEGQESTSDGRETASGEGENRGFQTMNSPSGYDLTLLCFDTGFVPAEDAEAAKNNACQFVDEYLSAHSEENFLELLSLSGTSEGVARANEVLESFYEEHGVECSLTKIRYQYGGVSLDYAAACEYAVFDIGKDWQDGIWEMNPRVSEDFLHEAYREVKEFFECNARQMEQYQELFDLDDYRNDLIVLFPNDTDLLQTSFYPTKRGTIYLKSVVSLMHEYIHFLMDGRDDSDHLWTYEGFARNYDCYYNEYAYDYWNYDYNNFTEIYGFDETGGYLDAYIEHIGRPISIETDYRDLGDFLTFACGWDNPDLNYFSGASFVAYLVDCYGLQEVIQYIGADKRYKEEWNKSYEELVHEWLEYIDENYSWYAVTAE